MAAAAFRGDRRLGVREVWSWRKGRIEIHVLRGTGSKPSRIDLAQLASFLDHPTTSQAILDYRDALRA